MQHPNDARRSSVLATLGLRLALLVYALSAGGCFHLDPPEGFYGCNPGVCPAGFVCASNNRCYHPATAPGPDMAAEARDQAMPAHDQAMPVPDQAVASASVSIADPVATAYTHAALHVALAVEATAPVQVELRVDDQPLATLSAPYHYDWDTTAVAEGPHLLVARATVAGMAVDSVARTVVVDRTPPTVTAQTPAPASADVSVHAPITVQFSEPIAPVSVTDAAMTLTSGLDTMVPKTLALSADGQTLTLTPTAISSLLLPAQLTAGVTAALTDRAGNAVEVPTAAWSWTLPSSFVVGTTHYAQPPHVGGSIAIDKDGHPVVVYEVSDNGELRSFVQRWDGAAWELLGGGPVEITGRTTLFGALTLDGSNAPVVVYVSSDPNYPKGALYAARWDGTAWKAGSTPMNPSATQAPQQVSPGNDFAIATDPSTGNVVIALNQSGITLYEIDQSANVKTLAFPFPLAGPPSSPALAIDKSGNVFLAYLHLDTTINAYVTQYNRTGKTWLPQGGAITPVAGQNCEKGQLAEYRNWLTLDRLGTPVVALLASDGTHKNVYVEKLKGAEWQPVGGPINPARRDASAPTLMMERNGTTPVVGLYELDAVNGTLYDAFIERFDGTGWVLEAGPINPIPGGGLNGSAGFALDGNDRPYVDVLGSNVLNLYIAAVNR